MQTVTVFFRFDDYSERSPEAVEIGLLDALRSTGTRATFAVIPAVTEGSYHMPGERGVLPIGIDKVRFLLQAVAEGLVEPALHGWNHRPQSGSAPRGEFIQIDRQEQLSRLQRGKECFHQAGLEATVFVPPWNVYDSNTLQALSEAGLKCISGGRSGPVVSGALRYLPATVEINRLREAIKSGRESGDPDPIVGVLLHPYDFEESGDERAVTNCSAFEQELRWLVAQPDVRVRSIGEIANDNPTLDANRFSANQPLGFESIFPPFVRRTSETPFYRSAAHGRRVKALHGVTTCLTYLAIALASSTGATFLWTRLDVEGQPVAAIARGSLTLLLLALLARTAMRGVVYFRSMLALTVLGGIFLAAWR